MVMPAQISRNFTVYGGSLRSCCNKSPTYANGGPGRKGTTLPTMPPPISSTPMTCKKVSMLQYNEMSVEVVEGLSPYLAYAVARIHPIIQACFLITTSTLFEQSFPRQRRTVHERDACVRVLDLW